ncbi:hypothetical protein CR513_40508, partial [Mucuna pruriens]
MVLMHHILCIGSERTRVLLTSAAFVHLKHLHFSKHTRNLSPAGKAILLSGPAGILCKNLTLTLQQMLARALAHYFESKLLLLDITDFSVKLQNKFGCYRKVPRMSSLFGSFSILPSTGETRGTLRQHSNAAESSHPSKHRRIASAVSDISSTASQCGPTFQPPLKRTSSLCFDEKLFVQSLYKLLSQKLVPSFYTSGMLRSSFSNHQDKLSGSVLILGSQILDSEDDCKVEERLTALFPYNIDIKAPDDETHLGSWKGQLEEDMKVIQFQDNINHIAE